MCVCTPEIRTPYCGKKGCEWPQHKGKILPLYSFDVVTDGRTYSTDPEPFANEAMAKIKGGEIAQQGTWVNEAGQRPFFLPSHEIKRVILRKEPSEQAEAE